MLVQHPVQNLPLQLAQKLVMQADEALALLMAQQGVLQRPVAQLQVLLLVVKLQVQQLEQKLAQQLVLQQVLRLALVLELHLVRTQVQTLEHMLGRRLEQSWELAVMVAPPAEVLQLVLLDLVHKLALAC